VICQLKFFPLPLVTVQSAFVDGVVTLHKSALWVIELPLYVTLYVTVIGVPMGPKLEPASRTLAPPSVGIGPVSVTLAIVGAM
jgi:hypothetical protein